MAHTVEWMVEGRVIVARWTGDISNDEIIQVDGIILNMLQQFPANTIHIMSDFTALTVPPSLLAFRNAKAPKERNIGWYITCGRISSLVRTIMTVLALTFRAKQRMFDTREQALQFLQRVDTTLPGISAQK